MIGEKQEKKSKDKLNSKTRKKIADKKEITSLHSCSFQSFLIDVWKKCFFLVNQTLFRDLLNLFLVKTSL